MKLADKIIKLRKQSGWSQEELAEKMNVSRQSVSKWEGAMSIPDLNKIIMLGEIFGVSTDYLLKDEIEEIEAGSDSGDNGFDKVSIKDAQNFVETSVIQSRKTALGTLVLLSSVLPLLALLAIAQLPTIQLSTQVITGVGITLMFALIGFGVVIIISTSHVARKLTAFKERTFELEYGVESIYREKLEAYSTKYHKGLSVSVLLFILSPIPLILAAIFEASTTVILLMVVLLIALIGIGVFILIPISSTQSAYHCLLGEGEFSPEGRIISKRSMQVSTMYWPLIVAIYLGWSFWTMDWHITWIVWPVAAVLFAAIVGLVQLVKSE